MVKLYFHPMSAPSRAVMLTLKALNLDAELISVDLMTQEHLKPDFVKKNPFHTVPTIEEDNGFVIWDSHAISAYLVEKYSQEDDSLYPKDVEERAIVDQRLHFNSNIFNARLIAAMKSILYEGMKILPKDKENGFIEAYNLLETLLEKNDYVAGSHLTVADLSLVTSVVSTNVWVPIASNRFPKIIQWLNNMKELPYYNGVMEPGQSYYAGLVKSKLVNKK